MSLARKELILFFSEGVDVSSLDPSEIYIFNNVTSLLEFETARNVSLGCSVVKRGRGGSYREVAVWLDELCEKNNTASASLDSSSGGNVSSVNSADSNSTLSSSLSGSFSSSANDLYDNGYASDWAMLVDLGVVLAGREQQRPPRYLFKLNATFATVTDLSSAKNPLVTVENLRESFPGEFCKEFIIWLRPGVCLV